MDIDMACAPLSPAARAPAAVTVDADSYAAVPAESWATAFLIRAVERRLLDLCAAGQLSGTVHTCIGQELTGLAIARALEPDDVVFSTHRCHGHYLARTNDVDGLLAELLGRSTGICGGRGGSQHLCAHGVFSSGIQGGSMPIAAGVAMAQAARQSGVTVAFIGDGTLGEGIVYESLNIASKWALPLVIVLEDNGYAQSTSQRQTLSGGICERAAAFGIRTADANTWDAGGLFAIADDVVRAVREDRRPFFLCVRTYRLAPHSKHDDDRDAEELRHYWSIDPLSRYAERHPLQASAWERDAQRRIDAAIARAHIAPHTIAVDVSDPLPDPERTWTRTTIDGDARVVTRLYDGLRSAMAADPRILCLGEDIEAPYGGAFKVTKDLSALFPDRVRNTPISEAAIVGVASGLALRGYRPIVEIMFGDFVLLAADQIINHAAKVREMYNGQADARIVVRTPMGGRRGYGPTHSQSLEKHFAGVPGTRLLAIHHRYDPALVYSCLLATIDRPTIVVENKVLYAQRVSHQAPDGFVWEHDDRDYPTSRLRPPRRPDLTIFCYGGALLDVEPAVARLAERGVAAEVVCPIALYPFDPGPVLASLLASRRLLVVEEGQSFCGLGAEVLALVQEHAPGLALSVRRLGPRATVIPAARPAEDETLPTIDAIVRSAQEVVRV